MIILDTNVISEAMRGHRADPRVLSWLRGLRDTPVTTVINRAELLAGLAVLPPGARRDALLARFQQAMDSLAECLPLVPHQASSYAEIVARRRAMGLPMSALDGLIAAIAMDSGAVLATRDVGGFAGVGLEVVDPWTAEPGSGPSR